MKFRVDRNLLLAAVAGLAVGAIGVIAVRFVTYQSEDVHYHANFALYVNGERDTFDNFTFYEEVQACEENGNSPKVRVHMHNNENHVVHVHDSAVTWGHFFANLGYGLTNQLLETDDRVLVDGETGRRLRFILNGEQRQSIANRTINDTDVLLVDYSADSDETLLARYATIPQDAQEYNHRHDPGNCAGAEGLSLWARLKRAVSFEPPRAH